MRILLLVAAFVLCTSTSCLAVNRLFSVRDSIEMSHFMRWDPDGAQIVYSPNGRYFAVVTSRGVIANDAIESTIWLFSTRDVSKYLSSGSSTGGVTPRRLTRLAVAVAPAYYPDSYEPVIENLHWLSDSSALLFQGGGVGSRRLYRVDIRSGLTSVVSEGRGDVASFSWTPNALVYLLAEPYVPKPVGQQINADARDVTGMTSDDILFSEENYDFYAPRQMWAIRGASARRLAGNDPSHPLEVPAQVIDVLAVAPDGHAAITKFGAQKVDASWRLFEPNPTLAYLRIDPSDPNLTSPTNSLRPMQYGIVDTRTGLSSILIEAPAASDLGAYDSDSVSWSPGSTRVLITNTFLPIQGATEAQQLQRHFPCRAAVVDIVSNRTDCLSFSRYEYETAKGLKGRLVVSAAFGRSDDDVIIHMMSLPDNKDSYDHYAFASGVWQLTGSSTAPPSASVQRPLNVSVKEDLNDPPALWAAAKGSHKKIWDPNPQLADLEQGRASEFHFKDSSGHEWISGLVKPVGYVSGHRYPLIIQTHGFVQHEFLVDGAYTTAFAARPFASAGFVVLQMGDSGDHSVSLKEPQDNLRGYETAIAKLDATGLVDPKRVGIIGFSRTCYYVESALIAKPGLFAAASITDGVDESYLQSMFFGVDQEGNQIYGGPPFGKSLLVWVRSAPSFNLDKVRTPLLITTIGNGSILGESEIYGSLSMQKKPVALIYLPQGQHILQRPLERLASQQSNVDWFSFWLQDHEDSDPSKAGQYQHWEALRKLRH